MNNQPTDNLCPLCDCPMTVSPAYSTPHQKWLRCLNDVCFIYNRVLPEHQIANSPNIRRIKKLEEALLAIGEFGAKNTGMGFTCSKMAKAALRGETTQ